MSHQDALQEMYNKEGKFPGPVVIPRRRPWTLLNFLFWASLLLSPLIKFAYGVAISGSPLLIIGFIIFLVIGRWPVHRRFNVDALTHLSSVFLLCFVVPAASIAIRRLIGVTEVKKTGSSYGDQEAKKANWSMSPLPPPCLWGFCRSPSRISSQHTFILLQLSSQSAALEEERTALET